MERLGRVLTLRRFNDGLSVLVVIVALYIFLLPFIPALSWWFAHSAPLIGHPIHTSVPALTAKAGGASIPAGDWLNIPSIGLDAPIYQGTSIYTVNKGIWLRPDASNPAAGGNSVMVGHRFTYTNPRGVFYYLDKIKVGDPIVVYWQGKGYEYRMAYSLVVPPTDVSIEASTPEPQLTLYTCTPLWSLKNRLVIVATLERVS